MSTASIAPKIYLKYFEGILPGMIEKLGDTEPEQNPREFLAEGHRTAAQVLANYQTSLNSLKASNSGEDYAYGEALLEDFEALVKILAQANDRPKEIPQNPILVAIIMSANFAQTRAIRAWFDKVR